MSYNYFDDIDREMDYMQSLEREFSDIFKSADKILLDEQKRLNKEIKKQKSVMYEDLEKYFGSDLEHIVSNNMQTLDDAYSSFECMLG